MYLILNQMYLIFKTFFFNLKKDFKKKKIFVVWECGFYVSDVIRGGLLGHLGPLHLALGPNR